MVSYFTLALALALILGTYYYTVLVVMTWINR